MGSTPNTLVNTALALAKAFINKSLVVRTAVLLLTGSNNLLNSALF